MRHYLLISGICILTYISVHAQNIGINSTGATPNTSSMLDIASTNKGLLIPRISLISTTDVATIAAPATSLLVYNTNASITGIDAGGVGFYYFDGSKWIKLLPYSTSGNTWLTIGNSGTVDGTNFIGTTDNVPLNFRINNNFAGRIDSTGANVFLGSLAGKNTTSTYNTALGHFALRDNVGGNYNIAIGSESLLFTNSSSNIAIGHSSMRNAGTATSNVCIGNFTMGFFSNGTNNVAIGERVMYNSSSTGCIGIGVQALQNNTQYGTIAIGYQALQNNSNGVENMGIGYQSLQNNYGGNNNTAVGFSSLMNNNGNNNTCIGDRSMMNTTNGNYNTCLGNSTLTSGGNANYNVIIGNEAMGSLVSGNENIAIGNRAMYSCNGSQNTAIGVEALNSNFSNANTAIGYKSIRYNSSGTQNTAIGYQTLQNNNSGNNNTAVGYNALSNTTNKSNNTAIGNQALEFNSGSNNIGIGNQSNASGVGIDNISVGNSAMYIFAGSNSIAIGNYALSNATGMNNIGIGMEALKNNRGYENTATGTRSLNQNTSGYYNTATGSQSLYQNTDGYNNTANGYSALYNMQSGFGNTASGYNSMYSTALGSHNTSIGENAFQNLTSGNYITGIGYNTMATNGLTNATAIGANAAVQQNNSLVLGSIGGINGAFANTNVGIGTTAPPNTLSVNNFNFDPATDYTYPLALQLSNSTDLTLGSDISFAYEQSWNSKPLLINSQGNNVGIGLTTAPNAKLHISGAFLADGAQTTHSQGAWLEWNKNGGGGKTYLLNQKGLGGGGFVIGEVSAANVITERISIDNNGNIGFGVPVPNAPLQFPNTVANRKVVLYDANNNNNQYYGFGINGGMLRYQVDDVAADHVFYAGVNSTTSNELLRIKGNGNVGIGVAPTQKLHVAGNGLFTGTVTASCGVLACSDIRYKKDIQPLQDALSKITKLQGVSYYFKKEEFKEMNFSDNKQVGLIAQEVEKIYPELVQTNEEGYKSIDYAKLTPILVEAIKELKDENEQLKTSDMELKKLIQGLSLKVEIIENLLTDSLPEAKLK